MADSPGQERAQALAEVEKEFAEVKDSLGEVHIAYNAVLQAKATDNVHDLLADLEDAVKEARDGGLIGSGANDHRRALRKFEELDGSDR